MPTTEISGNYCNLHYSRFLLDWPWRRNESLSFNPPSTAPNLPHTFFQEPNCYHLIHFLLTTPSTVLGPNCLTKHAAEINEWIGTLEEKLEGNASDIDCMRIIYSQNNHNVLAFNCGRKKIYFSNSKWTSQLPSPGNWKQHVLSNKRKRSLPSFAQGQSVSQRTEGSWVWSQSRARTNCN